MSYKPAPPSAHRCLYLCLWVTNSGDGARPTPPVVPPAQFERLEVRPGYMPIKRDTLFLGLACFNIMLVPL